MCQQWQVIWQRWNKLTKNMPLQRSLPARATSSETSLYSGASIRRDVAVWGRGRLPINWRGGLAGFLFVKRSRAVVTCVGIPTGQGVVWQTVRKPNDQYASMCVRREVWPIIGKGRLGWRSATGSTRPTDYGGLLIAYELTGGAVAPLRCPVCAPPSIPLVVVVSCRSSSSPCAAVGPRWELGAVGCHVGCDGYSRNTIR